MIDIQEYLKRVNQGYNVNDGYFANNGNRGNYVSQNNNNEGNNLPDSVYDKNGGLNYKKLEEYMRSRRGFHEEMTAYSPEDGYIHSVGGTSDQIEWNHPILEANTFGKGLDKIQTSSSMSNNEVDGLLYHGITNEYADKLAELLANVKEGRTLQEKLIYLTQSGHGIVTSEDYADLNTALFNAQMVTKTEKANILGQFFGTTTTNDIVVAWDQFDKPTAQEDLGEMEVPATVQGKYTSTSLGLKKDGWHFAWTRLAAGIGRRRNVIQDNLNALSNDFGRIINERIASVLATLTDDADGSWSSFAQATDLRNQRNPITKINAVRLLLKNTYGFIANNTLSNLRVAQDYINNTYVKGTFESMPNQLTPEGVFPLPKYIGVTHGIDDALADSSFFVFASEVGERIQGATIAITYTNVKTQVLGAIGYNWNNFGIKNANAGRQITSIT